MKKMRRSDRAIPENEAIEILENGEYGVLSTINNNHIPIGIPVNYTYFDGNIFIHCAREGEKLDSIAQNPRVSFTVVGKTKILPNQFGTLYESVITEGKAELIEGSEKRKALESLIHKYSSEYIEEGLDYIERAGDVTAVIRITIHSLNGKARR